MYNREASDRSILIVSSSDRFDAAVRRSLHGFVTIDIRKSAAMARRCIIERGYDLVTICSPLSDETGEDLAIDIAERGQASVMLATPQETWEDSALALAGRGILVISGGAAAGDISKAVRYLTAIQDRMRNYEQRALAAEQKADEIRVVSKAKLVLMEKKHMTEEDAHRHIGRLAMNNGISRRAAAEMILDDW